MKNKRWKAKRGSPYLVMKLFVLSNYLGTLSALGVRAEEWFPLPRIAPPW
jgi:hypothetical protein